MKVLYLALSTARARHVRFDTDYLAARGVPVLLLVSPEDDWSEWRVDRRVEVRPYVPAAPEGGGAGRVTAGARRGLRYARGAARRLPVAPVRARMLRTVDAVDRRVVRSIGAREERRRTAAEAEALMRALYPAPGSAPRGGAVPALPDLVVIGGAESLPLARELADAWPGLRLTFELDWDAPEFAGLPVVDSTIDPAGAMR